MSWLTDPSQRILIGALDGLSTRQSLVAANLANIDTPGYQPQSIDFETTLRQQLGGDQAQGGANPPVAGPSAALAMRTTDPRHFAGSGGTLTGSGPDLAGFAGSTRNDGNTVDLESEMTALAESQLKFAAISRLLTSKLGMLRDVANGGR